MNIDHLKLFIRIASTHNISQAGSEQSLSPAVASNYITKLENDLGVRLIHRTTRKVSLTSEGQAFLPYAEDVISSMDAARASVGAGNVSPIGTLRIAAPASFGRMHLMPVMKAFMAMYPKLSIDFRLSDTMVDLVEGGFDVAIRNAELKDSTLIAKKIATDKRSACASPEYLEKYGTPASPEDLQNHLCINLAGLENWTFKKLNEKVVVKTKGVFKADNGEALRDACVAGLGVTIVSNWVAHEQLREGKLVKILEPYPLYSDTAIWAVYPSSRLLAPKVRVFIDFLVNHFTDQPYWDDLSN